MKLVHYKKYLVSTVDTEGLVLEQQDISSSSAVYTHVFPAVYGLKYRWASLSYRYFLFHDNVNRQIIWVFVGYVNSMSKCDGDDSINNFAITCIVYPISMGWCKKDVTPLLTHWSYIFLAPTHRYDMHKFCLAWSWCYYRVRGGFVEYIYPYSLGLLHWC